MYSSKWIDEYFYIVCNLDQVKNVLRNALNSEKLIRKILEFYMTLENWKQLKIIIKTLLRFENNFNRNDLKDINIFELFSKLIIFRSLMKLQIHSRQ